MMKSTRRRLWIPEVLLRGVPAGVQRAGHRGERLHGGEPGQRDGRTEEEVLDEVLPPVIDPQATHKRHDFFLS